MHDLDAAAELYRQLGFQVGARNRHPRAWGTQNHIVQLPGTVIELLSVADESGIAPHAQRHFSFGAFNRDFLKQGAGLAMLVLDGKGASDVAEFRSAGIGDFELYELKREGNRPDGSTIKVAFALAFAANPLAPETGFFTCLHHHPENFWNPAFQIHPNKAMNVAGVVFVAENPDEQRCFFAAFSGAHEVTPALDGFVINTGRGDIQVMTPAAFGDQYGVAPSDVTGGASFAAVRFAVRDLGSARPFMASARDHKNRLVLGPQDAMGAVLLFEKAAE